MHTESEPGLADRHPLIWTLGNLLAFQACWWTLILTGPRSAWLGLLVTGLWALIHLSLTSQARADLLLMGVLFVAGPWLDVAVAAQGWLEYHGAAPYRGAPPYWIFGLWLAFAMTVHHAMRGIFQRPLLAALLGAIGGPLAYYGGSRFGAATLPDPATTALLGLGLSWAAAMLLISLLSRQLVKEKTSV